MPHKNAVRREAPAGDGETVMLGLQNEREWAAFCKTLLRQPELAADERFASNSKRVAHKQALRALIDQVFAALDEPPRVNQVPGAMAIQACMDRSQWVTQPGNPVSYCPRR